MNQLNQHILDFLSLLLEKEPSSKDRTEILKFFLLPRNTSVRPLVELPDENIELGTVKRPTAQDQEKKMNPIKNETDEAMKNLLKEIHGYK